MSAPEKQIAEITDHLISLYYFIADDTPLADLKINELATLGLPTRFIKVLQKNSSLEQNLWLENPIETSQEFLTAPQHLLAGEQPSIIIAHYSLNPIALAVINGKLPTHSENSENQENSKNGSTLKQRTAPLSLRLTSHVIARLQQHNIRINTAIININNLYLSVFNTGIKVLVADCYIDQTKTLHPAILAEVLHSLSRINSLYWNETKPHPPCNTRISMGELIRKLARDPEPHQAIRSVYTYSYIQWQGNANLDLIKTQLVQMTKHFDDAYQIKTEKDDSVIFQENSNIVHCISPEGSATAVIIEEAKHRTRPNYKNTIINLTIMPLQLLIFYQSNALNWHLEQTNLWLTNYSRQRKLATKQQGLLLANKHFGIRFLKNKISSTKLFKLWQKNLAASQQLDQLAYNVSHENTTISELLMGSHPVNKQLRNYQLKNYGLAVLTFSLTLFSSQKALAIVLEQAWLSDNFPETSLFISHWNSLINGLLASIAMLCVFSFNKTKLHKKQLQQSLQNHQEYSNSRSKISSKK